MPGHRRPDIISTSKASSHPLKPGRFYAGEVLSVNASGQVNVIIKDINVEIGPIVPIGTTPINKLSVKDEVICTFTDEFAKDVIVFGSKKIKQDIFAGKVEFQALQAAVTSLAARVTALEAE